MKSFVRLQKIPDAGTRLEYIAREGRFSETREQLLLFCNLSDSWQKLIDFEKSQSRKTNEARELIIALPNEMAKYPIRKLRNQCNALISSIQGIPSTTPKAYAVHWNYSKTNLHLHYIFGEREMTETHGFSEPKRYRQDIWAKADGTRALKKEDRHHIMHHKGDMMRDKNGDIIFKTMESSGWSEKNRLYKDYSWLNNVKLDLEYTLQGLGYEISSYDPDTHYLPERHEGKGNAKGQLAIRRYNRSIRKINTLIKEAEDTMTDIPYLEQKEWKREVSRLAWRAKLQDTFNFMTEKIEESKNKIAKKIGEINEYIRSTIREIQRTGRSESVLSIRISNDQISKSKTIISDTRTTRDQSILTRRIAKDDIRKSIDAGISERNSQLDRTRDWER